MGELVSGLTDFVGLTNYGDQETAARNATNAQKAASRDQLAYQKEADRLATERMQPWVDAGMSFLPQYQEMMTPGGQMDYLSNSPMFQAAINNTSDQLKTSGASQGKFGSGGLVNQLFQNYLGQGNQFVNSQFNRLLSGVNLGQASSAGQVANSLNSANNISNIYGNQGDIIGSGMMAQQNINNAATSGGTNLLLTAGMMGLGGGGAAAGGIPAGIGGSTGMGMSSFSDRRLKTDIKEVDRDELGGIYEFRYKGDDLIMIGRMADELQKTRPDAVFEDDSGYLMVTAEFKPRAA